MKITTKWYSIVTGTILLLLILIVLMFIPCPTPPQLNFLRILVSIAAGAFAATIPGNINFKNNFITATSSLGVFVLVYLMNPVSWNSDNCNVKNLKAVVFVDGKVINGVIIKMPSLSKTAITDEFGVFNAEYLDQQIQYPFKVYFEYKSEVDTLIVINNNFSNCKEFLLKSRTNNKVDVNRNSISYKTNDLDFNISLINSDRFDSDFIYLDTVLYSFQTKADTTFIIPNSRLIDSIKKNGVVFSVDFLGEFIAKSLPKFDFKITNNSNDGLFLNEIEINVIESELNINSYIIPTGLSCIGFENLGLGDAKDVSVDFNIAPYKDYKHWKIETYKEHYKFDRIPGKPNPESYTTIDLKTLLVKYGIPPIAFEYGELQASAGKDENISKVKFKKAVGRYDQGGIAYGIITYTDADRSIKKMKFETTFEISGGYGAVEPISANYDTKFKDQGNNYMLSIPISQTVQSKGFDRFSLTYGAEKPSNHYFKISLICNSKKIEIPQIFCFSILGINF